MPGWQFQSGSRMVPGRGRESEEFHAKMPSAASTAKQLEDSERGKLAGEVTNKAMLALDSVSLASVSLKSLTVMASTCPSLAELMDYRGFYLEANGSCTADTRDPR